MKYTILLFFLFTVSGQYAVQSQVSLNPSPATGEITLEDIFKNKKYVPAPFKMPQWVGTDHEYVQVKNTGKTGTKELWLIDPVKNSEQLLVGADKLITKPQGSPLNFTSFELSNDKKTVIFTKQAGNNGQGPEYWFLDMTTWILKKLGLNGAAAGVRNITVSPDLKKIAFCKNNNIYVEYINTGLCKPLTTDGAATIINANSSADFANVLNVRGFKWSPDSRYIAFTQFDTKGVKELVMINNTDSLYPFITKEQYVKPGEQLPACRVGITAVENAQTHWLNIPGNPADNYISYFEWQPSYNQLFVQQMSRKQNHVKIFNGNINGKTKMVYEDSDAAFLLPVNMLWIDGGNSFLWISEKSGWRHIYQISADGTTETDLVNEPFDIAEIAGLNIKDQEVFFMASPENAIYRYLYSVKTDGSAKPKRRTPGTYTGMNEYHISNDGKYAFHHYSNINTPPVISLVSLAEHGTIKILENNSRLKAELARLRINPAKFLKIDIGNNITLDAWQILPPDFDATKKYPVIFHEYSMPGSQQVQDRWLNVNNYMWYQMMAQKGFIIMNIDARGTPSLYGREWRKVIYGRHGILPSDDLAKATRKLIADFSYIDEDNIGIFGWSGGGMISLLQILRYPDLYKAAVPGAYLSSSRLYHAGFTERFLGLPQENPRAYDTTAAINYVNGLKGHLLLMHGTGDNNVNYQSTEVLINQLIAANKKFYVMPYPNRNHGMMEGINTKLHQFNIYTSFFLDHLSKSK